MLLKQMVKVRSKQYYCIVEEDRKVRVQENRGQKGYRRRGRKGQEEGVRLKGSEAGERGENIIMQQCTTFSYLNLLSSQLVKIPNV